MSVWLNDAIHLSDGTVGGTAKVVADAMLKLPQEQQPWWVKHRSKEQLYKDCTKAIIDSYTTMVSVTEWVNKQLDEGRSAEDAYEEIRYLTEPAKKSPLFPRPAAEEDEDEAAKRLDDPQDDPADSAEEHVDSAEEAIASMVGRHMSSEEAQMVKDSLKRDSPFVPHKGSPKVRKSATCAAAGAPPSCLSEAQRTRTGLDRRQRKALRKVRKAARAEKAKAEAAPAEAPPAEPREDPRSPARAEAAAVVAPSAAAPEVEAPAAVRAEAEEAAAPPAAVPAAGAPAATVPSAAPNGRRSPPKAVVAEAAEIEQAVTEFIREPLMLLGSPNSWDKAVAQAKHRLRFHSGRKPTPGKQESRLRLEVPADGMDFQIVSSERPETFVLCPGSGRHELRDGERGYVSVRLEADAAGKLPSFFIEGAGEPGEVEIRVSLSADGGMQVWFNEL